MSDEIIGAVEQANGTAQPEEKLTNRNLIMFSMGTIGRDFIYNLFNSFLISYILFTKHLDAAQFASISIIIIVARLFDAFNDPFMGGIVENTRTKWGKFKPWQLIGAVLTAVVVIIVFSVDLSGWDFIAFLAFIYFMFSITFTMNDISYWGMMPSLTSNEHDRSKITSISQLAASAGGGLAGILIPALTTGKYAIGNSAVIGYKWIAIIAGIALIGFQLFTIFGVKEKPLPTHITKSDRLTVKQMFKTILKNDQLMWSAIVMLIFTIGTNVVAGGLSMSYIYFEFGYNGILLTLFGVVFAITSTLFTLLYPIISKKFGRDKILYSTGAAIIIGYALMLICGLAVPTELGMWKFAILAVCNGIVGYGQGFYMIMVISIANSVEYNEWKTGKRDEGLIFSLRPFTAKLGSALMQGIVMIVYIATGVLTFTNQISDIEHSAITDHLTDLEKMALINNVTSSVPQEQRMALLACMCLIPIAFMIVAVIIYKKKCILNEEMHARIVNEIAERKQAAVVVEDENTTTIPVCEIISPLGDDSVTLSANPNFVNPQEEDSTSEKPPGNTDK